MSGVDGEESECPGMWVMGERTLTAQIKESCKGKWYQCTREGQSGFVTWLEDLSARTSWWSVNIVLCFQGWVLAFGMTFFFGAIALLLCKAYTCIHKYISLCRCEWAISIPHFHSLKRTRKNVLKVMTAAVVGRLCSVCVRLCVRVRSETFWNVCGVI